MEEKTVVATAFLDFRTNVRTKTVSLYLSWADLDVEVASLVGDLEYLWPGEAVDPQAVPVDEQAVGAHTQHDVNPLRILGHRCRASENLRQRSRCQVKTLTPTFRPDVREFRLCSSPAADGLPF